MLEPVVPGCSPAEQAALEQALRALPPEQREVVHLHVYEGMTFQEVANATGESINTDRRSLSLRARQDAEDDSVIGNLGIWKCGNQARRGD